MTLPVSAADLLDAHEKSRGKNPKSAVKMVIWLMIYDEEQVSWVREFLEDAGVFPKPETETIRANQLQKVHRLRTAAEKSTGLPGRGKKGFSDEYCQALVKWRALNPRPSKEQLLAGWIPKPIVLGESSSTASEGVASEIATINLALPEPTPPSDSPESKRAKSSKKAAPQSTTNPKDNAGTNTTIGFADPKNPTEEELRALSRKTEEDSRLPPKLKPAPPIPPKFIGPPAPVNGTKATADENAEFKAANLAAKEKYIAQIETDPNWRMKDSWKGRGDPDDYVEYIGPPWE